MNARYRRRVATDAAGQGFLTLPVRVLLTDVVGAWAGGAGTMRVEVDGRPLGTATGTGSALVRLDRPELVDRGRTITVSLPAQGTASVNGDVR